MDHRALRRQGLGCLYRLGGPFRPERSPVWVAASIFLAFQQSDRDQPGVRRELPGGQIFRKLRVNSDSGHLRSVPVRRVTGRRCPRNHAASTKKYRLDVGMIAGDAAVVNSDGDGERIRITDLGLDPGLIRGLG